MPVTGANRIPHPAERPGRHADRLFGITPERAQQVWYSIPYATKRRPWSGRTAARSSRSTISRAARRRAARRDAGPDPDAVGGDKKIDLQRFDDEATGLQALIAGQIDLVGTGLLVNRALNRNDPGKNYEVKIVLRPLHFGIGIRRGETDLLQWLNTFVYTIKNNGELDAISRKWRELPLGDLPVF